MRHLSHVLSLVAGAAGAAAYLIACETAPSGARAGEPTRWEYAFLYAAESEAHALLPEFEFSDRIVEGCAVNNSTAFTCALNVLAEDGWEVVGIDERLEAVLKRPVADVPSR